MTHGRDFTSRFSALRTHSPGLPPVSTRVKSQLVLAPMDSFAKHLLCSVLTIAGWKIQDHGPLIVVSLSALDNQQELLQLQTDVDPCLHSRVRAAITANINDRQALLESVILANTLDVVFDCIHESWMTEILTTDSLYSLFHPIVDAKNGGVFGFEALMRAHNPNNGELIGAAQLLYAARRLGIGHQLDRTARIAAIHGAAKAGILNNRLFINFDPNTIYDPAYCLSSTFEAAEECGTALSNIVFEVTETEKLEDTGHLRKIVRYLREHGAGVALDDIGSGFSTFQFLAEIGPDYVKIDGDLVTMAMKSSSSRHAFDSLVNLARRIGVKVIAEGVESEGHLRVCMSAGVDFLQGFFFALPAAPPEQIRNLHRLELAA